MGFGLLFIGYFVTYIMSYVLIPKLLGCVIMLVGVIKLSEYELKFKRCIPVVGAMSAVSTYMLLKNIFEYFRLDAVLFNEVVLNIVSTADEALAVLFHVVLLIAITSIAKSTGIDKLCFKAMRNLLIVAVAEIAYFVALIIPASDVKQIIFLIALCLRFLWIVLNLILMASCYRMICDESDVDMPDKEINIPVVKQMENIMRRRDKNAFDSGRLLNEKRRTKKEAKKKK